MEVEGRFYDDPSATSASDKADQIFNNNVYMSVDDIDSEQPETRTQLNQEEEKEENNYSTVIVSHSSSETGEVNHSTETVEVTTTVTATTVHSDTRSMSSHSSEEHRTLQEINQVLDDEEEGDASGSYALNQGEDSSEVDLDEMVRENGEDEPELFAVGTREVDTFNDKETVQVGYENVTDNMGNEDGSEGRGEDESNIRDTPRENETDAVYDDCISPMSVQPSLNEHVANGQPVSVGLSNGPTAPSKNTSNSSGTFVMRSVGRADPLHVVRRITQDEKSALQPNPELDEMVTIIKSNNQGHVATETSINQTRNIMKQKVQSWLTTPLVNQFNKESEMGSEDGQFFAPKGVGPAGSQTSYLALKSQTRTSVTDEPGNEIVQNGRSSRDLVTMTATVEVVDGKIDGQQGHEGHQGQHTAAFSTSTSEQQRAFEISRAIEAAEFRPVAAPQSIPQPKSKTVTDEKVVIVNKSPSSGEGLSIYSKQNVEIKSSTTTTRSAASSSDNIKLNTVVETLIPTWKAEVERRKQTKEYVVSQKPEQPLRLADMPDWKKQLHEKKKSRKLSTDVEQQSSTSLVRENGDLEWKAEIKSILRQKSGPGVEDVPLRQTAEWERLADEKK